MYIRGGVEVLSALYILYTNTMIMKYDSVFEGDDARLGLFGFEHIPS